MQHIRVRLHAYLMRNRIEKIMSIQTKSTLSSADKAALDIKAKNFKAKKPIREIIGGAYGSGHAMPAIAIIRG